MPAQVVSTGVAYLLVPVRSREAIKRAQPDAKSLYTQLHSVDGQGCYLFSLGLVHPAAVAYTCCFNPTVGIVEDPATGSAAGPLACYLATYGHITSEAQVMIEQGYAQERPSHIEVRVFGAGVTVAEGVRSAALKREKKSKEMNPQPTIGIISPGDMGHAIGAVLRQHGLRILTNLQDRSARTAALAAQAGIIDVADDQTLVYEADILLSVLVPAQATACAERVAAAVRATHTTLLFADCNAISPRTVQSIEYVLREAGADVVDVGIIGSPPQAGRAQTRLYVSGPAAERLKVLNEYGLEIRAMGPTVGQASGLKMCYASVTKGLTALASEALTAGQALGLTDVLTDELRDSQGALFQWFERQIPRMPPKAYRWVGEMEEIARTFADLDLPPQMLEGAAALYRLVERTELGSETPEERHLGQTLEEVTAILAAALKKEADQLSGIYEREA